MALHLSPLKPHLFHHSRSVRLKVRQKTIANLHQPPRYTTKEQGSYGFSKNNHFLGLLVRYYKTTRWSSSWALSCASTAYSGQSSCENDSPVSKTHIDDSAFNRVKCLKWVLDEAAKSFSVSVKSLELLGSGPAPAMAWSGKDVHGWHRRISYQVAVYALLKTAIEVEVLLSSERHYSDSSPVNDIGVAGMVVAISCCAAVAKLGYGRVKCPFFAFSIEDVMVELMDLSHSLVSVERLHNLATEAGFEWDFLSHFGRKVLLSNRSEEIEFWIGLADEKLSTAFNKESVIPGKQNFHDKGEADTLATLGLFAYLGRRTRLFLSRMGIKDLDELVQDFPR